MNDPNAALAATVVGHLIEAGLVAAEDEAAVAEALATGKVSPDDWVRWIECGQATKGVAGA